MSLPVEEGPDPLDQDAGATGVVGGLTRSVAARIAKFPLSKAAAVFAVAQLADLATALNVTRELNPIVNALAAMPGTGQVIKVALIVFVIAVARLADGRRPVLARLLLAFGAVAGMVGAFTNTPFTPFVS